MGSLKALPMVEDVASISYVSVPLALPVITGNPPNRTICVDGNTTFSVAATDATGYQWQVDEGRGFTDITNGAPYSGATTTTLTITGATASMNGFTYRCVVSGDGSAISNAGTLNVPNISSTISQTNVSCFGGNTGSATASATGGIAPYTYLWAPSGGTAATATGLSAGTYTVTVTDANGCTAKQSFTIMQPICIAPDVNKILYVNKHVNGGNGSGDSWANAIPELADALKWAHSNKENGLWSETDPLKIYVAKGTYKPMYTPEDGKDFSADAQYARDRTFLMVKDVELYGGFIGNEALPEQRVIPTGGLTSTILTGDFNDDDAITGSGKTLDIRNNSENAHHVVTVVNAEEDINVIIDGFEVKGGNADQSSEMFVKTDAFASVWRGNGGGIYLATYGKITLHLKNSRISRNASAEFGGGIYSASNAPFFSSPAPSSSILLDNTHVHDNYSGDNGGGVYSYSYSNTMNTNSSSSIVKLENSSIKGNYSSRFGGGVFSYANTASASGESSSKLILNNSQILENAATNNGGGMMSNAAGKTTVTDLVMNSSRIHRNSSDADGGGIYMKSDKGGSTTSIHNSALTENTAKNTGAAIYSGSVPFSSYDNTIALNNSTLAGNIGTSFISFSQGKRTLVTNNSLVLGNTKADNSSSSLAGSPTKILKYSLVQGESSTADGNINAAGITAQQIFADVTNHDYSLKLGAVAIGTGDNDLYNGADITRDKDLAGNPRLVGSKIDMGAYEFQQEVTQLITASALTKTYGDAVFEPGATVDSGRPLTYSSADDNIAAVYQDAADGNKWKITIKKVGTVTLTARQEGGHGYLPATKDFTMVISPKAVTVSIVPTAVINKDYDGNTQGSILPAQLAFAVGDIIGSDDVQIGLISSVVSYGTKDAGTGKTVALAAGNLTLNGNNAENYQISNTVELTANVGVIERVALSITAKDENKNYDAMAYTGGNGVVYAGFVNNEDESILSGTLGYEGSSQGAIDVGVYAIEPQGLTSGNYGISYKPGKLTIEKAVLPAFTFADATYTYDGTSKALVATGLPTEAKVTYVGNNQTNAGEYSVTAMIDGGNNYMDGLQTARLIIKKAKQTISFTAPETLGRDAGTVALDVRTDAGLLVSLSVDDPSVATVSDMELHVHRLGTVKITATQAGDANHEAAKAVTVTVRVVADAGAKLPIVVHQALSPNGDGINEFLMIEGIQDFPENKVTIFDKNGSVQAEIIGYNNRDRVFTGKESREGTYYYYLDLKDNGVWKREKGYFVIRR
ncbi:T9SS type B sorting domain-containing protein [Sphingobacterium paucimobilis]|nr:gliding motility-associated C-terminal domain-containing protein [Sphingobacterium paucimobilis]